MSWTVVTGWAVRRRAVVGGHAVHAVRAVNGDELPYTDAACLALKAEPPGRRFACHMRSDGRFFFLDVPPGRYALERSDAADKVAQTKKVVVVPYASDTRMPVVQIDLEVVDPGHASG